MDERAINLSWSAACRVCAQVLIEGTRAWHSEATSSVVCARCFELRSGASTHGSGVAIAELGTLDSGPPAVERRKRPRPARVSSRWSRAFGDD